jgi:hypothetical protein
MRLIYLMVPSLIMTFSLAQAEQSTGTGYSEREACWHARSAASLDMEIPSTEIACKDSKDPDCGEYFDLGEFYNEEDCVCTDRTPGVLSDGRYDKSKRNPDRWVCTVNYYKIPGKW